ncbi:hypothetical protein [Olleya sp.]|jgi:hypothetical protein|uniref:hypothetical protein n=1 Tax=Olleya sp. TaxID=1906788 RepID=UPI0032D8C5A0
MIPSFRNLKGASSVYLENSFKVLNEALENESIDKTVYDNLEYSEEDLELMRIYEETKKKPIEHLRNGYSNITNVTFIKIKERRALAIINKESLDLKFPLEHNMNDMKTLLHITNFALFFETIINRHLLFLKTTNKIDPFEYKHIEKSSVINKILFITKGQNLSLNFIAKLFTLRNFAVHYTADNANNFGVTIEILKSIWKQVRTILITLEKKEQFLEEKGSEMIQVYMEDFNERWN